MVDFGESALIALSLVSFFQIILPFIFRNYPIIHQFKMIRTSQFFQTGLILFSFSCLVYAYVTTDLTVFNVAMNSHQGAPLLYKITGVWGNHEGSMMLWLLILIFYGTSIALSSSKKQNVVLSFRFLGVQSTLVFLISLFIIYTSNPFIKAATPFLIGRDLNPILQDPALAFHPPILYLGLIGFSIPFSFAIASLTTKKPDLTWIDQARKGTLFSWSCLTIGISLGSWWAYYELGWGGWWFWDPVENASLMPWLASTALIHLFKVIHKKEKFVRWCYFLSILCFLLSLLGTLLVRSGLLSSVHTFSQDPQRGIILSVILGLITGGSFGLFCLRFKHICSDKSQDNREFFLTSRTGLILLNNHFLMTLLITVVLSLIYPLIFETFTHEKVTIGTPYFMMTFVPLSLPILIMIGLSGWSTWYYKGIYKNLKYLWLPLCISLTILLFLLIKNYEELWRYSWSIIIISLSSWIISSTVLSYFQVSKNQTLSMTLSHLGFALSLLGMSIDNLGVQEKLIGLRVGESTIFKGFHVKLNAIDYAQFPTYQAEQAIVELSKEDKHYLLTPEKRYYPSHQALTTETSLYHSWFSNFYIALGNSLGKDRWTLRLYYHPWIEFIWLGASIMALGGFLSLSSPAIRSFKKNRYFLKFLIRFRFYLLILFLNLFAGNFFQTHAVEMGESLKDPLFEQRARDLSSQIKCPVCVGQSIEDSQASLAHELRLDIRRLIVSGLSDEEIYDHLRQRYGDEVLFKPAVKLTHGVLWFLPFIFAIVGLGVFLKKQLNLKINKKKKN